MNSYLIICTSILSLKQTLTANVEAKTVGEAFDKGVIAIDGAYDPDNFGTLTKTADENVWATSDDADCIWLVIRTNVITVSPE